MTTSYGWLDPEARLRWAKHIARPRSVNGAYTGDFLYSHGDWDICPVCQEATEVVRAWLLESSPASERGKQAKETERSAL